MGAVQANRKPRAGLRAHSLAVLAGRVSNMLLTAASVFVLTRVMGQSEFGSFAAVFAITQASVLAAVFGLDQIVIRELSKTNCPIVKRSIVYRYLAAAVIPISVFAVATGMVFYHFGDVLVGQSVSLIAVFAIVLSTVVRALTQLIGEICRALDDPIVASLCSGLGGGPLAMALFLATCVLFRINNAIEWETGVTIHATAGLVTALFGLSWIIAFLLKPSLAASQDDVSKDGIRKNEFASMRQMLFDYGFPVFLASGLGYICQRSDIAIVSILGTPIDVALFEVATRLALLAALPMGIANTILIPRISRLLKDAPTELEILLRTGASIATIISLAACGFFVFAPELILRIGFGTEYVAAAPLLIAIIPGYLAFVLSGACGNVLIQGGRSWSVVINSLICAVVACVGGVLSWHFFGAIGVAVTTSITMILQNSINWLIAYRIFDVKTQAYCSPKKFYQGVCKMMDIFSLSRLKETS
ncbi:Multi antimicrobial extrusion protein MatE [Rhodopirellula maiorica SM1]|uniref:Multi antimicrobial extrusion protein MatE n=1 Tax=Rhodopirellula maiorica SM1 TaxID=1265738 RepID=M5RE89_9BACT|nr:oligosaccharide flippase family protein [Rhodopirellula maiorica]EMI17391.1 Multi antimicrobial extrusion protein MatE [Rhodopirellula maiorica SM1]